MLDDRLARDLYAEICRIPLIDPHSHINPHRADGHEPRRHPRLPLLHRAGPFRRHGPGAARHGRADRANGCASILGHMDRFDNTVQYHWFLEIARTFLGFEGDRLTAPTPTALCDAAERVDGRSPDWEEQVLRQSQRREDLPDQRFRRSARRASTRSATSRACGPTTWCFTWTSRRCGSGWRRRPASRSAMRDTLAAGDPQAVRALHRAGGQGVCHLAAA